MKKHPADPIREAYTLMRRAMGHQNWWPGDTPLEICVGAILTQNTNWSNVERAIANLKQAKVLTARKMYALQESELAELLRPSGYFNVKAKRLRAFLRVLIEEYAGKLSLMFSGSTEAVRERLLAVNGIGKETADSMLLYASEHRSFVIDAYTKRIFMRHGWCTEATNYDELQAICVNSLSQKNGDAQLDYWRDYHAQLVMIGKDWCRPRAPKCETCPLNPLLPKD